MSSPSTGTRARSPGQESPTMPWLSPSGDPPTQAHRSQSDTAEQDISYKNHSPTFKAIYDDE